MWRCTRPVSVYSTKTGALLWKADGQPNDRLGIGVEGAGDVNHDGVPDVIASAPGGGYAKVYSGRDGRVLHTFVAEQKSDAFGRHVSTTGDVDRDGFADVIVGAPGNNAGGAGAGRAYVYSGKDGHVLLTLTGQPGWALGSSVAGSRVSRHIPSKGTARFTARAAARANSCAPSPRWASLTTSRRARRRTSVMVVTAIPYPAAPGLPGRRPSYGPASARRDS